MKKRGIGKTLAALLFASFFGPAALSACSLDMVKEDGYTEGRYEVNEVFSSIEIDADGGVELYLSYGAEFSVTYTESAQEQISFSVEDGTLKVEQRSDIVLMGYQSKRISVTVPSGNPVSSVAAGVDGNFDCTVTGEYGSLDFETGGWLDADLNVSASSVSLGARGAVRGTLVGSAEQLTVTSGGAMTLDGGNFSVVSAALDCGGKLDFALRCSDTLGVVCGGECDGVYYGDPAVTREIAGEDNLRKGE